MTAHTPELQAVLRRLEKLEKQNSWLKRAGMIVLVFVGALVLMGQARPKNHAIEAEEFHVVDSEGKTRALLASQSLIFVGANGKPRVLLSGSPSPGLTLADEKAGTHVNLTLSPDGPELLLDGYGELPPHAWVIVKRDKVTLDLTNSNMSGTASLELSDEGTHLRLFDMPFETSKDTQGRGAQLMIHDAQGFKTVLGTTETVTPHTGETHKSSASSIVMFDKSSKVIWRAP